MQNRKERFIIRFICSYFCVLIPVLMVSLFVFDVTAKRSQESVYAIIQGHADRAARELTLLHGDYATSSMTISRECLMLGDFWADNSKRYQAIQTIKNVAGYDPSIYSLFLHNREYGVFSTTGYSQGDSFFSNTLILDSESIAKAYSALGSSDKQALLLLQRQQRPNGFLMLHYPFEHLQGRNDFSVNYLISFDQLAQRIRGISSERNQTVYVRLTCSDGTVAYFMERNGVMSPCAPLKEKEVVVHREIPTMQMSLDVFYDPEEVYASLLSAHQVNMWLLAFGTLVSTLLSTLFSTSRIRNIRKLEKIAKGEAVVFAYNNEYAYIGGMLHDAALEKKEMVNCLQQHSAAMRQQTAQLILSGGVKDRPMAVELLKSCGVDWNEEFYFIGCASFDASDRFEINIPQELICRVNIGTRTGIAFFGKTSSEDVAARMKAAKQMESLLQTAGATNIVIGLSRTYKEIALITMAFSEAEESLKMGGITCFESVMIKDKNFLHPDQESLTRFADALRKQDFKSAQAEFDQLDQDIRTASCNEKNKQLIRMYILQSFLLAIDDNEKLLQDILHVSTDDADRYTAAIHRLIRKYAQFDRSDVLKKCMDYINENYADPLLSAENVADYLGLNKTNLGRMFKSMLGKTYIEYLSEVRIEKAKELLRTTDLSISDIATRVGYYDRSGLYRKFKALVGIDATEYRRQHREDENHGT